MEKSDLDCTDFESRREAELFYEYISGEDADYLQRNVFDDKACFIDPYGLDADHDCEPCEDYFTPVDAEMIRRAAKQSR